MKNIWCFLVFTIVLTGCTTYRDASLDEAGTQPRAVLIHKHPAMSGFVVYRIDGNMRKPGITKRYEIPPGKRSVILALNEGWYHGDKVKIEFEARAGEEYVVDADAKLLAGRWWAWVTEVSTGKRWESELYREEKK